MCRSIVTGSGAAEMVVAKRRCYSAGVTSPSPSGQTRRALFPGPSVRAGDGARTHDPQLGKLMLYQLSYARVPSSLAGARPLPSGLPASVQAPILAVHSVSNRQL